MIDIFSYLLGRKSGGGGDEPTGTVVITSNGTHDVKQYAYASVNVTAPVIPSAQGVEF